MIEAHSDGECGAQDLSECQAIIQSCGRTITQSTLACFVFVLAIDTSNTQEVWDMGCDGRGLTLHVGRRVWQSKR